MLLDIITVCVIAAMVSAVLSYFGRDTYTTLDRNIADKVKELPRLISSARYIKIATDFDPAFFGKKEVVDAFNKAAENNAEIKILIEGSREELAEKFREKGCDFSVYEDLERKGKVQIKFVEKLNRHLWIMDGAVRVEAPHQRYDFNTFGIIFRGFPSYAKRCSEEFERTWLQ